MSETKQLPAMVLGGVDDLDRVLRMATQAGLSESPAELMVRLAVGRDAGLGLGQSLSQVAMIKGRPTIGAAAQLALARRSGIRTRWETSTDTEATLLMWLPGDPEPVRTSYTAEMARRAGLGGDNWRKHPEAMLRARCITSAIRMHCPEVLGGAIYDADELADAGPVRAVRDVTPAPPAAVVAERAALPEPQPQSRPVWERMAERVRVRGVDPEDVAEMVGVPVEAWTSEHGRAIADAIESLTAAAPEVIDG